MLEFLKTKPKIKEPLQLVKYPDPRLKIISKPVEKFDAELEEFVMDLLSFMKSQPWGKAVGFAAPQAGRNIRVFIALDDVYINPEILWKPEGGQKPCREGCFSLEEKRFDYEVTRAYAVKLRWQDLKGAIHEDKFTGFKAQVIQHEMDHLNGKLCCGEGKQK